VHCCLSVLPINLIEFSVTFTIVILDFLDTNVMYFVIL
jgi:hypothetical protein